MPLKKYYQKRKFDKTPEPKGKIKKLESKPLHFVIQKHDASRLHYDFRLELGGVLKSWAIPKGPSLNPNDKRLAVMVEDHPIEYQNFEGKIPKGQYGGGDVIIWDRGVYSSDKTNDRIQGEKILKQYLDEGELTFVLFGEKLKGKFTLIKLNNDKNEWLLIKGKDEYASNQNVLEKIISVKSGKVLPRDEKTEPRAESQELIKKLKTKKDGMPKWIKPMLAKSVEKPFNRKGWFFEPKWDGYRAITFIKNEKINIYSRNQLSFNEKYPLILKALSLIKKDCILDGEIIALKNGKPDFHSLQLYEESPSPLNYVIFDLLYYDNSDLRSLSLKQRKDLLRDILPENKELIFGEHIEENGEDFFKNIIKQNLEGMVAKDSESKYLEGVRSNNWLKIKNINEQEAIIIGFTKPRNSRKFFGALVLGAYENNKLKYIGHSGGGFKYKELEEIFNKLSEIKISKPIIKEKVPVNSPITWVKPKYVCEIRFSEWTPDKRMRHPIYMGLRIDKNPEEVRIEPKDKSQELRVESREPKKKLKTKMKSVHSTQYSGNRKIENSNLKRQNTKDSPLEILGVKFSNLDKIFWPDEGFTKKDVIEYYDKISDIILPYLKDKPQNLNRHPNGINGKSFYHKNMTMKLPDFIVTKKIWSDTNNAFLNYIVCNNKETLLYLANLGCIEINPWNSKIDNLENPDYMILDLDPGEKSFEDLIIVAEETKKILDLACTENYPKTSGKKGIHIIIPLGGKYNYEVIRNFAELLMHLVNGKVPDLTSLERIPKKRNGKIYLDYLQNRAGQTLACAYSLRPYKGATISTPLEWREIKKGLDPSNFNIKTIWKRLDQKGDLWKPTLGKGVDLNEAIRCLQKKRA